MSQSPENQSQRRVKYGLLLAALVAASIAIVVLLNIMVYKATDKKTWQRFDLTSDGRYSLSEQSRKILGEVKSPVRLYALMTDPPPDLQHQQIAALIDLYSSYTDRVKVESIDPAARPDKLEQLSRELEERFAGDLKSTQDAVKTATAWLDEFVKFAGAQAGSIDQITLKAKPTGQTAEFLRSVRGVQADAVKDHEQFTAQIKKITSEPLPDYGLIRQQVGALVNAATSNLEQINNQFKVLAEFAQTTPELKTFLVDQIKKGEPVLAQGKLAVGALKLAQSEAYDEVRDRLARSGSVLMIAEKPADGSPMGGKGKAGVMALTLDQVYTAPRRDPANPDQRVSTRKFIGEEVLTGAILNLSRGLNLKVVFVNPNSTPAVGFSRGSEMTFNIVAEQLRRMNFEVEDWMAAGRTNQMGRPMPADPAPRAEPGQTMVLVVLPALPAANSPIPIPPQMPPQAMHFISEHIRAGQPAFFFSMPSMGGGQFGPAADSDPVADLIRPYGVKPQTGRIIFTGVPRADGQVASVVQLEVRNWEKEHAVGAVVAGLRGMAYLSVPIEITNPAPEGVKTWVLAKSEVGTWSESSSSRPETVKKDDTDPAGPFPLIVAAERNKARIMLVGNHYWATDAIASVGFEGYPAALTGAQFPANTELFVNGVLWLAGMDQIIAATASTQDVGRIAEVSQGTMFKLWFLVLGGFPLLCLGSGIAIWLVRRK